MPRTVHPALHSRLRDLFGRIPFVCRVIATEDDSIVEIVLEDVFREPFRNKVAQIFFARVFPGAPSIARALSVGTDVIEKNSGSTCRGCGFSPLRKVDFQFSADEVFGWFVRH